MHERDRYKYHATDFGENLKKAEEREGAETPEAAAETPASFRELGAARYAKLGENIKGAREKFGKTMNSWGEKIGRFGENAKKFGMEGMYMALSADKWAKAGAERAGQAISRGAERAGDSIGNFGRAIDTGIENTVDRVERGMGVGYDAVAGWSARKAEQAAEIGRNTADVASLMAGAAKERTVEAATNAAQAIGRGYENVRAFGRSALEAAGARMNAARQAFSERVNAMALRRLEEQERFHTEEAQKVREAIERKRGLASSFDREFAMAA